MTHRCYVLCAYPYDTDNIDLTFHRNRSPTHPPSTGYQDYDVYDTSVRTQVLT